MGRKNYTATIEVAKPPKDVFNQSMMFQNGGAKILKAAAQNSMTNLSFAIPIAIIQNRNWLKLFPTKKLYGLLQKANSIGLKKIRMNGQTQK